MGAVVIPCFPTLAELMLALNLEGFMRRYLPSCALLCLLGCALPGLAASPGSPSTPPHARVSQFLGNLPLSFVPNQGQWGPEVKFSHCSQGLGVSIHATGLELALERGAEPGEQKTSKVGSRSKEGNLPALGVMEEDVVPAPRVSSCVQMRLQGANPQAKVFGRQALPGKVNYFVGQASARWHTNLPIFREIVVAGAYPGVDVRYYGNGQHLEFDFELAPGADPDCIQLDFEGTDSVHLDQNGNVVVPVGDQELLLYRPAVYQFTAAKRISVEGRYVVASKASVRFQLGDHDHSWPLVIDPVLSYSTYFGGRGGDLIYGLALDSQGDICVSGVTTGGVPLTNAFKPSFPAEIFVTKLTPDGASMIFSTYFGGTTQQRNPLQQFTSGAAIAVDDDGNIMLTGTAYSEDFPVVNAFQPQLNLLNTNDYSWFPDAFVAKLTPDGDRLIYSTYLGGHGPDSGTAIAVDHAGNAYVAGSTFSTNFPIREALCPNVHGLLCAYNPGSAGDTVPTNASWADAFVSKFNPAGALLYSTYLGGTNDDWPTAIKVDAEGAVYLAGTTTSFDFPTTPNTFQYQLHPPSDGFFLKLSRTGREILYSTYLGGVAGLEVYPGYLRMQGGQQVLRIKNPRSVTVTLTELRYTWGWNSSEPAESTPHVPFTLAPGQEAVFTVKESSSWTARLHLHAETDDQEYWVTLASPDEQARNYLRYAQVATPDLQGEDSATSVALDQAGIVYLAGNSGGFDFPVVGMAWPPPGQQSTGYALYDIFAAKFGADAKPQYVVVLGSSGYDSATGIAADDSGNAYIVGSTSTNDFPVVNPLQPYGGGTADAFLAELSSTGSSLLFSTFLGGSLQDAAAGVAVARNGDTYVAGYTTSTNFPTAHPLQPADGSPWGGYNDWDGFIARISPERPGQRVQLHEKIRIENEFASTLSNDVKVQFLRPLNGSLRAAETPVLELTSSNVMVRVPVDLVRPDEVLPETPLEDTPITVRVISNLSGRPVTNEFDQFRLIWPRQLVYDEVFAPPAWAAGAAPQLSNDPRTLLQFHLGDPNHINDPATLATFFFRGRRTDGMAGLRVLNTAQTFSTPLRFEDQVSVFEPDSALAAFQATLPFHFLNVPYGGEGLQFNVRRDGLHLIVVEVQTNSVGPFPAPFQIHLAGNVGGARKIIDGGFELPRGTRREALFNHSAPHRAQLGATAENRAETALLKFANLVGVSPYPLAVLIPPAANGFPLGIRPVRAPDPLAPLEVTTPTARTPACSAPLPGTVIDITQVPVPAAAVTGGALGGTVCGLLGNTNGTGFSLPFSPANGVTVQSVILDLGSGQEIVDGTGNDLALFAGSGSYRVAVGNSPYADDLRSLGGTLTGNNQLDLAASGLGSARYVLVSAAPTVALQGVKALNQFADQVDPILGPSIHTTSGTILVRRAKAPMTQLDPFLTLISPDGDVRGENESGFGDDISADLSDAALVGMSFSQDGFWRYLVKGFDQTPDEQSYGICFTRLESEGRYDPVDLVVSDKDESHCPVQRTGTFDRGRQRDSYVFQAAPGSRINVTAAARGTPARCDPLLELFDPEDFLIAACDNYSGRGKDAVLSLTLPSATLAGAPLPSPSTYRVVISAADQAGAGQLWEQGKVYLRSPASGQYELKIFTGQLANPAPADPTISSIDPLLGPAGTLVIITGSNFSTNLNDVAVFFGTVSAVVSNLTSTTVVAVVPEGLPGGPLSVTVSVSGHVSQPVPFTVSDPPTVRTAAARLECLSLRFQTATASLSGQSYTLALSSSFDPTTPNGELYALGPNAYGSTLLLQRPDQGSPEEGGLDLSLPLETDSDANGLSDFLEISQAVRDLTTEGSCVTVNDLGFVQATWNRPAGSKNGSCHLQILGGFSDPLPEFDLAFELLEYSGTLQYRPEQQKVSGNLALVQAEAPTNTVAGGVLLTRSSVNPFDTLALNTGAWIDSRQQTCSYSETPLTRQPPQNNLYLAQVTFDPLSPLSLNPGEYAAWQLVIQDTNDSNLNGIPDLSDDSQANPAQLVLKSIDLSSGQLTLPVSAPIGTRVELEQTSALTGAGWNSVFSITVSKDPEEISVSPPAGQACFYRLHRR